VNLTDSLGDYLNSSFYLIVEGIKPSFLPEPQILEKIEVPAGS